MWFNNSKYTGIDYTRPKTWIGVNTSLTLQKIYFDDNDNDQGIAL